MSREITNRDELIHDLAEILAGLQVPLSMDGRILGAAAAPYRQILRDSGYGWRGSEDFEEYLRDRLDEGEGTHRVDVREDEPKVVAVKLSSDGTRAAVYDRELSLTELARLREEHPDKNIRIRTDGDATVIEVES
jgi:hypothetical protein